jgi:hypothetical protein
MVFQAQGTSTDALILNLPNRVFIAGETLIGSIDLNVLLAQQQHIDSVKIKWMGLMKTLVILYF